MGTIIIRTISYGGTGTFDFPPAANRKPVKLTLNIVAPTTAEGVTYRCQIGIVSGEDDTVADTLVVEITTY